jgi:hypothetical protein
VDCEISEEKNNVPEKMDCEISERKQINNWHDKWIVKLVRENKLTIGMINGLSN